MKLNSFYVTLRQQGCTAAKLVFLLMFVATVTGRWYIALFLLRNLFSVIQQLCDTDPS